MKSVVSAVVIAVFAFCPITFANAQSSPPNNKSSSTSAAKPPSAAAPSKASTSPAPIQTLAAAPAKRTDIYHIHFNKAAAGKAVQLAENLKAPNPQDPMPGHMLILRHQEGDAWDYAVIQHMGTTATIDAARPAPSPSARDLSDWHTDTYVNGPSWAEFTKAMGIDEATDKTKTVGSVYVLSVYRPVAGHRDQLEKMLSEAPTPGDTVAGTVLMQHLEGDAWTYLTVSRYNSWQDFATNETNSVASSSKNEGGWFQLREHISFHTDTLTNRIFP